MQVNAHLDLDVVALEQDDEVTVMLELLAPQEQHERPRPPATLEVVLDRSGSMSGERLQAAQRALIALLDRLDPRDRIGIVAFDDEVQIVAPCAELSDRPVLRAAIAGLYPGGSTNLSGGLLRGLQEARRVAGETGATVLLLSDGHANVGETDPGRLSGVAAGARRHGVTVSTVGIGLGYDELLLSEIAKGGQGNHVFAENGDAAAAAVAGEVQGLLSKTVQAASLLIRPQAPVASVHVWNDLPAHGITGGVMAEVGDLWAGERRTLLISLAVPARLELGLAQVAELELRYVTLPELAEQTITIPIHVNVVFGDEAAGRVPNPVVRTELAYQQAQDAKRRAADALRSGDIDAAAQTYAAAEQAIDAVMLSAPSPELAEEREILERLRLRTEAGDREWSAKTSRADQARKSRTRGRRDLSMSDEDGDGRPTPRA
jgi:Ca-activated chloride channel family protein